jgi:hypothetical protein
MNDIETTHVLNCNSDDVVMLNSDGQPPQTSLSANASCVMPEESPPTPNISPQTRRTSVYPNLVPNAPFWVQINSKSNFNRDDYQLHDEEFNIVGIIGEIGPSEDLLYEIQFEDGHTAIVPPLLSVLAHCSCQ